MWGHTGYHQHILDCMCTEGGGGARVRATPTISAKLLHSPIWSCSRRGTTAMAATQSSPLNVRSCLRIVQLSPACQEGQVQKHAIKDQHGLANVGGRRCGWQLGWGYIQGNTINGLTAVVLFFFPSPITRLQGSGVKRDGWFV